MRLAFRIILVGSIVLLAGTFIWYTRAIQPIVFHPPTVDGTASGPFDDRPLRDLLARCVDSADHLDGAFLSADPGAQATLDRFLSAVEARSPRSDPAQFPSAASKLRYWVAAYAAASIRKVTLHAPLLDVRDVQAPFALAAGAGFYRRQAFLFGKAPMTLHGVREDWVLGASHDPRVLFALGGVAGYEPAIMLPPTEDDGIDAWLTARTHRFLGDPGALVVDVPARVLRVAPLILWHREFLMRTGVSTSRGDQGLMEVLRAIAPPDVARRLDSARGFRIEPLPADWSVR